MCNEIGLFVLGNAPLVPADDWGAATVIDHGKGRKAIAIHCIPKTE